MHSFFGLYGLDVTRFGSLNWFLIVSSSYRSLPVHSALGYGNSDPIGFFGKKIFEDILDANDFS